MPRFFFFFFYFYSSRYRVLYHVLCKISYIKREGKPEPGSTACKFLKRHKCDVKQYGSKAIQRLKWTGNSWAVGERAFPLRSSWLPHPLACAKALTCPRSRGTLRLFSTSKNYPKTIPSARPFSISSFG